eukprot:3936810-Rhodomonas_salina.1
MAALRALWRTVLSHIRDSANARSSTLLLDVVWTIEVPGTVGWSSHVTVVPSLAHTRLGLKQLDRSDTFCSRSGEVSSNAASASVWHPIHDRLCIHWHTRS